MVSIQAEKSSLILIDVEAETHRVVKSLLFGHAAIYMSAAFNYDGSQIAFDGPLIPGEDWKVATLNLDTLAERIITPGQLLFQVAIGLIIWRSSKSMNRVCLA